MAFRCSFVDDALVVEFDPIMHNWLRVSLPRYRGMVQSRIDEYREYDSLCEILGIPLPVTPLNSAILRTLRDNWCGPTGDDALDQWREADLMTRLREDADVALSTMPARGQPLELHYAEEVESWFWVLTNLRIGYGVQHGVLGPDRPPLTEQVGEQADWSDPQTPARFTVWWLGSLAHALRKVSGQPLPEYSFY
ncbi:uncharacterized protein DUF2017 [Halopolyspora algeriensis]|uniref:Uncharacterized protein DUF2017 n=1 Tax=Halopolyspora algeriensis TaxID=1500506 RepID=A0A368VHL8_9ACTN|nr:DUF2017 family protein [Halopolyspora algeriensis]RCW38501.1 uncharacterized protein DUF2017 [Halopolyspora algeriensis]TQM42582.1 uncharacterized protein DUF2017 [Halopolyspora algeriensis]